MLTVYPSLNLEENLSSLGGMTSIGRMSLYFNKKRLCTKWTRLWCTTDTFLSYNLSLVYTTEREKRWVSFRENVIISSKGDL